MPIDVGDPAQDVVDAHPVGTTFLIRSGVHFGFSVLPKAGQTFRAEAGAILDGSGNTDSAFYAFRKESDLPPNDVTIAGASKEHKLVIRRYTSGNKEQVGAIHPQVDTRPKRGLASGWVVRWVEITDTWAVGLRLGDRMSVVENYIHHNGALGIGGSHVEDVLVEGNEISDNRTRPEVDPEWEGGGAKFVLTKNLSVRSNYVHHNRGPGLWTDIDNVGTLYEENRTVDNDGPGIFHEISHDALIRRNTVIGNGRGHTDWLWGAGIVVAASDHVEVAENVVRANVDGIAGIQQDRDGGRYGEHVLDDFLVHHNLIENTGSSGVVQDVGDSGVFRRRILFDANVYRDVGRFAWNDDWHRWPRWQSFGHELQGTYS